MKIIWTITILIAILTIIFYSYNIGYKVGQAQIVKEALSKLPHGQIDMFDKDNWQEFREKMLKGEK